MQAIDEVAEVVGRAEARRRRVVGGHLVAPGSGERVCHHRQQLDVREAEIDGVGGELVGELVVGERAVAVQRIQPPGAEVHLVDRHRSAQVVGARPGRHPIGVAPHVPGAVDDRVGAGRHLGREGERIGLQPQLAGRGADLVLVVRAVGHVGHEQLPYARAAEDAHRVQTPVPGVEVPDDAHRPRGRCPDGERGPRHAVDLARVRTEPLVQLLVPALADEVQVELAEHRQERVRVTQPEALPSG